MPSSAVLESPVIYSKKTRSTAFASLEIRNIDSVEVDTDHGRQSIEIPATVYTSYWAILKFMYLNHSRKIYGDELSSGVRKIMREECPEKLNRLMSKEFVITNKRYGTVEQKAKPLIDRIVSNGRNLCRIVGPNAYGLRLVNRGHVLRYETGEDGRGYFVMFLMLTTENLTPQSRGRKKVLKKPIGS